MQSQVRSVSGQSPVSLKSVSNQSQVSLRSVSGQSQVSLRSVSGLSLCLLSVSGLEALLTHFVIQSEPKILRLVQFRENKKSLPMFSCLLHISFIRSPLRFGLGNLSCSL